MVGLLNLLIYIIFTGPQNLWKKNAYLRRRFERRSQKFNKIHLFLHPSSSLNFSFKKEKNFWVDTLLFYLLIFIFYFLQITTKTTTTTAAAAAATSTRRGFLVRHSHLQITTLLIDTNNDWTFWRNYIFKGNSINIFQTTRKRYGASCSSKMSQKVLKFYLSDLKTNH